MPIEEKFEKNVSLANFTTFKIGGPAKLFLQASSLEDIVEGIKWAKENGEKYHILGGGSNLIVSDNGYNGLIIKNDFTSIFRNDNRITCNSGLALSRVLLSSSRHDLTGLEWSAGIPGTVGGAIYGNAGAFGQSMGDIIESVKAYLPDEDRFKEYSQDECGFSYRESVFKQLNAIILGCTFKLTHGKGSEINQLIQKYVTYRSQTQPKYPCAGSVFKNIDFEELKKSNPEIAQEAEEDDAVKNGRVGSGWLISKLHLKGKQIGGAMVSMEHANFIVNRNFAATAEDVMVLISLIKQKVRVECNIQLNLEVQFLDY